MRILSQFFLVVMVATQFLTSCKTKPVTKETKDHGYTETFEGDIPPMTDVVIATFDTLNRINDLIEALEIHKGFMEDITDPKALNADTTTAVGRELYTRINAKAISDADTYAGILKEIHTLQNGLSAPGLFYDSKEIAEGSSDKLLKYMAKNYELYVRTKNWQEGQISPLKYTGMNPMWKSIDADTTSPVKVIVQPSDSVQMDGSEPDAAH